MVKPESMKEREKAITASSLFRVLTTGDPSKTVISLEL